MQIFACPACGARLYFHNAACPNGHAVRFDPDRNVMVEDGHDCSNRNVIGCTWRADILGTLCPSCAMTEVVPDLRDAANHDDWARTEFAKRWVLANLARWNWFTSADPGPRPQFRLLSERTAEGETPVTMGHADGLITINAIEASEAVRVVRRDDLGERYRTMVGHIRHELAHFLFLRLSADATFLDQARTLFGDERADYGEALERHYADPAKAGDAHVTSYATAHPHEDWAETTAHLLHLVDLLDSASAAGLGLDGKAWPTDAYATEDGHALISHATDAALAINHVNRALDLPDLYPFTLGNVARDKLSFVHRWLRAPFAGAA